MIDDPEGQRLLELARRARTPSAADKAAVERRLIAALGVGLGASAASAAGTATAQGAGAKAAAGALGKGALLSKLAWPAGLAGVLLAGYAATIALEPSEPASKAAAPQRAEAVQNAPSVPFEATAPAAATAAATAPGAPSAALVNDVPSPSAAPARVEPSSRPARPARTPAASAQQSELDLLHRAQIAWRAREPHKALTLLGEHRARFAGSSLALEREALRAVCLCELGRSAEGARLARSVLGRAESSPLRATLEQACSLR